MKRKVLALISALTFFAMGSLTAVAASPTVDTTEAPVPTQKVIIAISVTETPSEFKESTSVSEGFKVEAVEDTTVKAAAVAVQNKILNDVAAIGEKLGKSNLVKAAAKANTKVTAEILTVVEVSASTAPKDEAGNYVVTMNIEGVKKGDSIAVLHYNGKEWETIIPSSVEDGKVTFTTPSLSPISVVKLSTAKVSQSPKTGETVPVAAVLFIIGLAGAAVCGKKYFA